jgi:hypothetical protein
MRKVWSIAHDSWDLLFPVSDVILRKYEKRDGTLQFVRSVNVNRYIGCNTTIRRTGVFDQGVFAKACKNDDAM